MLAGVMIDLNPGILARGMRGCWGSCACKLGDTRICTYLAKCEGLF